MKKYILPLLLSLFIGSVNATIVDFEENWTDTSLSSSYDGLTFSSDWNVWDNYSNSIWPQGSGTDAIYISPDSPVNTISFSGNVNLNSLWLGTFLGGSSKNIDCPHLYQSKNKTGN